MLVLNNVNKSYRENHVIKDLSLSFEEGKVYSIIGPNGVGKTTLINLMAGIANADNGTILLEGLDTKLRHCKAKIGYAVSETYMYPNVTIIELIKMVCEIKYEHIEYQEIKKILIDFELYDNRNKLIEECSMGMKKKLGIIISFLGEPKLILLDEPTNGVDTKGIIMLKSYIHKAKKRNAIIIITSHVLDFVNAVSEENIFVVKGKTIRIMDKEKSLEQWFEELY